jgi:hypothetical protein
MPKNVRLLIAALLVLILISGCRPAAFLPAPSLPPQTASPLPTEMEIQPTAAPTRLTQVATRIPTQIPVEPTPVSESWVRTYKTIPPSAALGAFQNTDGTFLLVGATNYSHRNNDNEDIHLMKVDPSGEQIWEKTYGGEKFDRGMAVIPADGDATLVLAETSSYGAGEHDIYLLKIDPVGDVLWAKTFGGTGDEQAKDIQVTNDGGYIITGTTDSFGDGSPDVYLIKTDGQANEQWSRAYGGELIEEGYDVTATPDGGFLILAASMQPGVDYMRQQSNLYLIRTSASGDILWEQVYDEPGVQGGYRLLPVSAGEALITGLVSPTATTADIDPLFLKLDSLGNLLWEQPLGNPDCFDYASDIQATSDGGYVLTGMALCNGRNQVLLIKIDPEGEILWQKYLVEGDSPRIGLQVFEMSEGVFLIIGQINTGPGPAFETLLIKTDELGDVQYP